MLRDDESRREANVLCAAAFVIGRVYNMQEHTHLRLTQSRVFCVSYFFGAFSTDKIFTKVYSFLRRKMKKLQRVHCSLCIYSIQVRTIVGFKNCKIHFRFDTARFRTFIARSKNSPEKNIFIASFFQRNIFDISPS